MRAGLVSVSFRRLTPAQIIVLAKTAGLDAIEWGGDVHVPPDDPDNAGRVGDLTRSEGLEVACYGSYYRLTDAESGMAEQVVATAKALGAPLIRVWAGQKGSRDADADYREMILRNLQELCDLACAENLSVALEYHGGTLTDDAHSALALLEAVDRPNMGTLWQPPVGMSTEDCLKSIETVAHYIDNIHVFSWDESGARLPLREGREKWKACLTAISRLPGQHSLMLEFVRNDDPMQLIRDAAVLRQWMEGDW